MKSLTRIEQLPPAKRSSSIGQLGVSQDLSELPRTEAIQWLEQQLASPVSREWGSHLYRLQADWDTLSRWLAMDKSHALAALDAMVLYSMDSRERTIPVPGGASSDEISKSLNHVLASICSPRVEAAVAAIRTVLDPVRVPAKVRKLGAFLFGSHPDWPAWKRSLPVSQKPSGLDSWNALCLASDGCYSLATVNWRSSIHEVFEEIESLPLVGGRTFVRPSTEPSDMLTAVANAQSVEFRKSFVIGSIDIGDDYCFLVLRREDRQRFEAALAELRGPERPVQWLAEGERGTATSS